MMNSDRFTLQSYLDSLAFEGREIIDRLASGFHFQIYLGRVELGKRLPASLSLSNDSDMGGGRGVGVE